MRQREQVHVGRLLSRRRLVTLTGPPGIGKTWLARRVAAQFAGDRTDATNVIELEHLADGACLHEEVALGLGVPRRPGWSPARTLVEELPHRQALVVLDGCEAVAAACASLVADVVGRCPGLTLLVTSRAPLGVYGEVAWAVPPLDGEEAGALLGRLSPQAGRGIGGQCRRLGGLPLALELMAPVLAEAAQPPLAEGRPLPPELAFRLSFALSQASLPAPLRSLLPRLAVFTGCFRPDSAARVCASGQLPAAGVRAGLRDLARRGLIHERPGRRGTTFLVLRRPVREAALRQLGALDRRATQLAHRRHWLELAGYGSAEPGRPAMWTEHLLEERDDLRAVLRDGAAPAEERLQLAVAAGGLWERGRWHEGRRHLRTLLGGQPAGPLRASALHRLGRLEALDGRLASGREYLACSLTIGASDEGALQDDLAAVARRQGDRELAFGHLDRALRLAAAHRDRVAAAGARLGLGELALDEGAHEEAAYHFRAALDAVGTGDQRLLARGLRGLCLAEAGQDPARALALAAAAERTGADDEEPCLHPLSDLGPLHRAREVLGVEGSAAAWAAGGALDPAEALALAVDGRPGASLAADRPAADPWARLPRRQVDVLNLAAAGLTDKEIAARLGISLRTVRTYLERLYRRQGVRGRTQLVARWAAWQAASGGASALLPTGAGGVTTMTT
jgi:predicted ATPase/DNA-binding CsgD family transcriptional regulator